MYSAAGEGFALLHTHGTKWEDKRLRDQERTGD